MMLLQASDMDIDLGQLIGAGTITVFVMDWVKKISWIPWINQNTTRINAAVSLLVAMFTATGIKMISTGTLHTGGTITITFPAISVIINTLVHGSGQFGWQELLHRAMGNHVMGNQILGILQPGGPGGPPPPAAPAPAAPQPAAPPPAAPPPQAGGH